MPIMIHVFTTVEVTTSGPASNIMCGDIVSVTDGPSTVLLFCRRELITANPMTRQIIKTNTQGLLMFFIFYTFIIILLFFHVFVSALFNI